jgi:hypothetical protein
MNKTTIAGLTISQVERTHAWWRYLWPIQTRRALLTTLTIHAVCLPLAAVFLHFAAPQAVVPLVICGALGGLYFGLYPYLPARLTLATRGEARHFTADVAIELTRLRYVASEQPRRPGNCHYRSKTSRSWRWDEQDIDMLVQDHALVLNGPVFMLAVLRARLLPPENFDYLDKKA